MKNRKLLSKSLAVGVIILFFTMSVMASNESSDFTSTLNRGQSPIPVLFGTLGENGWYVSIVIITFNYDPKLVDEIQYYLHGSWHIYTGPVEVSGDGVYGIDWYWIDEEGRRHDESPIEFKIDRTPPSMEFTKKVGSDKITFTAATSDGTSLVKRVEFYVDDDLEETDNGPPYEYIWTGAGIHYVHAVSYNYAGLSIVSEKLDTTKRTRSCNFQFINNIIQRIYQIFFRIQQIYLN